MAEPIIYVDADACPVKPEVLRLAGRAGLTTVLVANNGLRPSRDPLVRTVIVPQGADAADDWIVEHVTSSDIVVTEDVPLAHRAVEKTRHRARSDRTSVHPRFHRHGPGHARPQAGPEGIRRHRRLQSGLFTKGQAGLHRCPGASDPGGEAGVTVGEGGGAISNGGLWPERNGSKRQKGGRNRTGGFWGPHDDRGHSVRRDYELWLAQCERQRQRSGVSDLVISCRKSLLAARPAKASPQGCGIASAGQCCRHLATRSVLVQQKDDLR